MATHSEWNEETTATEVAKAFSKEIEGKNVLITGVSPKSLGEDLSIAIAAQNPAILILASRTRSKLETVAAKIKEKSPKTPLELVELDLSSQESCKTAAKKVNELVQKLDVVINNAAVMDPAHKRTKEGLELLFGTNHVGHFLFTNLIMDRLLNAADSSAPGATRVVNVTSAGHRLSPVRFHDYNFDGKDIPTEEHPYMGFVKSEKEYNGFISYAQSKTANMLYSVALTKYLRDRGVVSYSVHPGSIWTDLSRNLNEEEVRFIESTGKVWKNQDQGAATMVVAAFDPALSKAEPTMTYMADCQLAEAADHAKDPALADRLWSLSEDLVGQKFEFGGSSTKGTNGHVSAKA